MIEEKVIVEDVVQDNSLELELLKSFVLKNTIPVAVGVPDKLDFKYHKKLLKYFGFKIREVQDIFIKCKFPAGWRKEILDSTVNWCYLIDNKNRKRAAIFYKFIKKGEEKELNKDSVVSHINYMQRYRVKIDHKIPFNIKTKNSFEYKESPLIGFVMDSEKDILFQTNEVKTPKQKEKNYSDMIKITTDSLFEECSTWLDSTYPDNRRIDLYWD